MSTVSINIHCCENLSAHSSGTSGAPFSITAIDDTKDRWFKAEATFFTDDQVLADRLVAAINTIIATRNVEKAAAVIEMERKASGPWRVEARAAYRVVAGADDTVASTTCQGNLQNEWGAIAKAEGT